MRINVQMIKRIFSLFLILALQGFYLLTYAKTVKVTALNDFSSLNPPYNFNVRIDEDFTSETLNLYTDYVLHGYIYKVIPPKRLKQDANFIYVPTSYTDNKNYTHNLQNVVATHSNTVNKAEIVVGSALVLTIGLIPTLLATTGFFAAEGALKDNSGDIIKSSVNNAYDKSCLSMVKKGNDLIINKNQEFLLNIAVIKNQEPNYSYTPAK